MESLVKSLISYREKISIKDIIGIIVGSFILAVSIQAIIVPAHLLTGGISGIAIMIHYFLTKVDIWVLYIALNIPIFLAGIKFISRRFTFYSLLGAFALTFFLGITSSLNFHIKDVFLASLLGGVIHGIGSGIVFRSKGSTGGLDIISAIIKRFWGFNIGETFLVFNLIIIGIFLFTANIELALFSAISIFVGSKTVDTVITGPNISKTVLIISDHSQEIAKEILHNMHRGCTYLNGKGAYTGDDKSILMVTVGKTQLPKLKEIVFHVDTKAFMTISESTEVIGRGFQSSRTEF
ncbi:MAG: YitT family protein [Syntrophomonas sp.]